MHDRHKSAPSSHEAPNHGAVRSLTRTALVLVPPRLLRRALIIAFAGLLALAGYYFYGYLNRPTADVYVAERGTAISAVYGTVSLASVLTLNLFAQTTGYLHLTPGFGTTVTSQGIVVKKDQVMGKIFDETTERTLNEAKTQLAAALARQQLGPNSFGALKSAQDRLAAYDKLPNKNMIPRVDYEAARNQVASVKGIVDNETLELQRQVDLAASAVKGLEDVLKRAEIKAPLDGFITAQVYNDNAYVTQNALLFTVSDKRTYVSGQVNEEDVGKLREGMKAQMTLYAYGSQEFTATLDAILPSPVVDSQRYTVTLHLDNPPDNVRIGLTGEMNIITGKKEDALVIPTRALRIDQVFVVENGVVAQRTVKTDFKSLEFVEVTEGLDAGAQVIVADQDAFRTGDHVQAVRINAVAGAAGSGGKKKSK